MATNDGKLKYKNFDHLMGSALSRSMQDMERQSRIVGAAIQASGAMQSIRDMSDKIRMASIAFNESEVGKITRSLAESNRLYASMWRQSDAFTTMQKSLEATRIEMLAFREPDAMKIFRQQAESSRLFATAMQQSEVAKQLRFLETSGWLDSVASQQSELMKQISHITNQPFFKALSELRNSPFYRIPSEVLPERSLPPEPIDDVLLEIESQLIDEISSETDFEKLPEKTKGILLYLYHFYFLPVILSLLCNYISANANEARNGLSTVSTASEAKAFVRSSSSTFDRSALKGFRVTTVRDLNLRDAPSMKGEVIEQLPIGTLLEVLDKSHRSWLLVEVEIDGEREQGWVSRRYTSYFK